MAVAPDGGGAYLAVALLAKRAPPPCQEFHPAKFLSIWRNIVCCRRAHSAVAEVDPSTALLVSAQT